jgi:Tfp pilus assembly protein PilO
MKTISSSRYQHLQTSLKALSGILAEQKGRNNYELNLQIAEKQTQLREIYQQYSEHVIQLHTLAKKYEQMSRDIKMNLLIKHLKNLKKQFPPDTPAYNQLIFSIQQLHRI